MADLSSVVGYLADIARRDEEPSFFLPGVQLADEHLAIYQTTRTPGIKKLAAIDALHREEGLLWRGGLWIIGEIDGVRYRWPIERQRIALHANRIHELGPWMIPPGLVFGNELRALALEESWGSARISPPRAEHPKIARLVHRYLRAAGLPDLPIVASPPPDGSASVVAVDGYFLDRDPFALSRENALRLWKGKRLDNTVLAALYRDETDSKAPRAPVLDRELLTPLPLNARQRQAIDLSYSEPLMAVSGDLLDRYPMVESLRFGDDQSVRRLSDKLASGIATADDHYDDRRLARRCDELRSDIDTHRKRIARRIGEMSSFEAALLRRLDAPVWLAQQDIDAIDLDAVRDASGDRDATGLLSWWKRRSAKKTLSEAFGSKWNLSAEEFAEVDEVIEAEQLVNAIAGRDFGLDLLWHELDRVEEQWRATIGDLLEAQRRTSARRKNRQSLQELASALRMGASTRRQALASVGSEFLEVIPLWVGTLGEIEAVLPVQPGLFDLVILDEASQISQLAAVPALARAKQGVIVGDSRQLRHVSFISEAAQQEAAEANNLPTSLRSRLNDRTNSIFDATTAVAPVVELDEHFRSAPHLIGFSDREFYGGKLRLMTQHPRNESRDAIEVITIDGGRNEHRVVVEEVDEVLRQVRRWMDAGTTSIGVLTPFRPQADALEEAILDAFTIEEIEHHQLRVGTVHAFQGAEREVMIISVGAGARDRAALRFLEDPALFNVMVTRARDHITLVTSVTRADAGDGLLGSYLRHADEPPSPRRPQVHGTGWAERVANDLSQSGHRVITDYEVAGETIDVVVGSGPEAFGIETEVHPAGIERHFDRRLALQRSGWEVVSLHRSSCYGREEEAIAELLARIATWPKPDKG